MRLKGKEYRQRLAEYSKSTLQLISAGLTTNEETVEEMHEITTNSELSEAEVRSKLIQLFNSTSTNKKTP